MKKKLSHLHLHLRDNLIKSFNLIIEEKKFEEKIFFYEIWTRICTIVEDVCIMYKYMSEDDV